MEEFVSQLQPPTQKLIENINPTLLVPPRDDPLPLDSSNLPFFAVGDRVVNALDNTPIPFGSRGTVVSVKGNMIDVLFDAEFIGGRYRLLFISPSLSSFPFFDV